MKILVEGRAYSGTPMDIVGQLAALHWDEAVSRCDAQQTLHRLIDTYERGCGTTFACPEGASPDQRAAHLFRAMQEFALLEIVDDA